MKIIGESENEVICSITKDEIAKLNGKYSKYNIDFKIFKPGNEVDLRRFFDCAYQASFLEKEILEMADKLIRAGGNLKDMAEISKETITKVSDKQD